MKQWMLLGLLGLGAVAQAHDVWVAAPTHQPAGQILHADLGYSHDFPNVEKIADDRVHIFKPLQLTGSSKKTVDLVNKGENYQYVSRAALPEGSYWVSATYKPTFWSKNKDGWKQQTLKQLAGATYCEQAQMFGKSFVQVGNGAVDEAVLARPIGQELELVPLKNPNEVKAGGILPVKVLYKGEPLVKATVTASSDTLAEMDLESTHDHREPQGFSGKTDKNGVVNVITLIDGLWKIKVVNETDYGDKSVCQKDNTYATLIVPVGTKRAAARHAHHHQH